MNLLQLKYFCHAAETQNFSHTAKVFSVPPSNITQSIKRLEKELDILLFVRKSNRITLSEQGAAFYQYIRSALDLIEEGANVVQGVENSGTIRIAIQINRTVVMHAITAFQKAHPGITVITGKINPSNVLTDFDLIVADDSINSPFFTQHYLFSDELVLMAPEGSFPEGKIMEKEDLQGLSFITLTPPSMMYNTTQAVFRDYGIDPHISLQCESSRYIPQCVRSGLGVAIVPCSAWTTNHKEGVSYYSLGGITRDSYAYFRKKRSAPSYVNHFFSILQAEYDAIKKTL